MSSESFKRLLKKFIFCLYIFINISSDFYLNKTFSSENNYLQKIQKLKEKESNKYGNLPNEYIIGPGDLIFINFIGAPFLSSNYTINQEGEINLPELNLTNVSGFTISELEKLLAYKYSSFIYNPEIKISILKYRSLQVYIGGEVKRPGIYDFDPSFLNNDFPREFNDIPLSSVSNIYDAALPFNFHRLDDVFRRAQGITNYADLSKIIVIRKKSFSKGGGKIKSEVNYLSLLEKGDLSKNIRVFDGDSIIVLKTNKKIKDQIKSFNESNLSPDTIEVYVIGNVDTVSKGRITLTRGSSLNQAIAAIGGNQRLTGKVEFIRFDDYDGKTRRFFDYDPKAPIESETNPLLLSGDIINIHKNLLGKTTSVLSEITSPLTNGLLIYKILAE